MAGWSITTARSVSSTRTATSSPTASTRRATSTWLGEASEDFSFVKFPFYRPLGYPQGCYRVGPLARLNVAQFAGTERADRELREFKAARGSQADAVCESFHYHLARLVEMLHAVERIEQLMSDPELFGESTFKPARRFNRERRDRFLRSAARHAFPSLLGRCRSAS